MSEKPEPAPHAIRRHRLIVDKPFQYRLLKLVAALWLSQTLFFSLVIYNFYQEHILRFYHLVPRRAAEPLLSLGSLVAVAVCGVALFSLILALVVGSYLSHQIAGPIHRLKVSLRRVAEGDYGFEIRFRQRDFLEDLPGAFNHLIASLRRREEEDLDALARIERSLAEPSTARELLAEIRDHKQSRLKSGAVRTEVAAELLH